MDQNPLESDEDRPFGAATVVRQDKVVLADLIQWNKTKTKTESNNIEIVERSKFPFNEVLNSKIYLWNGDITRLLVKKRMINCNVSQVDAIVNPSTENLKAGDALSRRIIEKAGEDIRNEIEQIGDCAAGESRLTGAYNLLCRHVIHTVGQKYNQKFKFAADHALFTCYQSVLQLCLEHKLKTIATPFITLGRRGHPIEVGAHLAIRTVRRFLEKYGDSFDGIIFCIENRLDFDTWNQILPIYFPRDEEEELSMKRSIPEDIGDSNGEPVIEERKIRISAFPSPIDSDSDDDDYQDESSKAIASGLAKMVDDPDEIRKDKMDNSINDPEIREIIDKYSQMRINHEKFEKLSAIYRPGLDSQGRQIIVVIGKNIPEDESELDNFLSYVMKFMEPIASKKFVVVYFHSWMSSKSTPGLSWLKSLNTIFDAKYSFNIMGFYVIHSTFWLRSFFMIMTPFISKSVKDKLIYCESIHHLLSHNNFQFHQLKLPLDIIEFDEKETGKKWEIKVPSSLSTPVDTTNSIHDEL